MSVLKYFKNIPRSLSHRATDPKCNFFFFKFATKSLEEKKGGACRPPQGRQGPVAHPSGDRVLSPVGGRHALFFSKHFFFPGTYFELFERVFVIIVGIMEPTNIISSHQ